MERYGSFREFWPFYVSQHLQPLNRVCHWFGTTLAFLCATGAVVWPAPVGSALLTLAVPLAGYGPAWFGHAVFEKNRPATWHSWRFARWSLLGDLRMWGLMTVGRMHRHVAAVRTRVVRP